VRVPHVSRNVIYFAAASRRAHFTRMGFVSIIIALALEQWRPLADRRPLYRTVDRYAVFLERQFNAGEPLHGTIAWLVAVLPATLGAWLLFDLLTRASPVLGLALNVGVLYATMGFRQFSHYFTRIHAALREGELAEARALLAEWRGHDCSTLGSEEIARLSIESALAASHRHVFGVIFWFMLLPGPAGAVLYWLALYLRNRWNAAAGPEMASFGQFPARAFHVIDWLPARLTAVTFAVVGDFEDAIYCWRTQAAQWTDANLGVVLAAGAGALGVRLGNPYMQNAVAVLRPELGVGDLADAAFLDSAVGLVWRAVVLWSAVVLVCGIARAVL
jgi:cobalamin biosynthesis protein CobD/CbiB